MLYFILVCLIILCGFTAAFLPKKKLDFHAAILISILCLPLGIILILTQKFK